MSKNVLIDISVISDCLMFRNLITKLRERGHNVYVTARGIGNLIEFIKYLDSESPKISQFNAYFVGKYGDDLASKLQYSCERIKEMGRYITELTNGNFDAIVSNTGVEACRVGFGLRAKVHTFWDHPEAEPQAKLTLPLSNYIYYPWIIRDVEIRHYNPYCELVPYKGFLHMAWIRDVEIDEQIIGKLGFNPDKNLVFFRESETKAAYLFDRPDVTVEAMKILAKKYPDVQFVTKPRYGYRYLADQFPKDEYPNVKVFGEPFDLQSLVAKADMVIGGGATISLEATYFGTPVISCRPINSPIETFIVHSRLGVRAKAVNEIVEQFDKMMYIRNDGLARRIYEDMKFPLETVIENIEGDEK